MLLQKKGLKGVNERFNHIKEHFCSKKQIENYFEMDSFNVKGRNTGDENGDEYEESESDECHTTIASSACNSCILPLQDGGAHCNKGIHKTEMAWKASVADRDNWEIICNLMPVLEQSASVFKDVMPAS